MPMEYELSFASPYVVASTSGVADRGGFTRLVDGIIRDERFTPGMPVLVDHTALDMHGLNTADMQAIADDVLQRNARIGRSPVAIVIPSSVAYGLTRQFVAFADLADIRVRIFASRRDAETWLESSRAA